MPQKIKDLYLKHRELIMYLIFGVLTTAVDFIVYFIGLRLGTALLNLPAGEPTDALRTAAQISAWIFSVLFAFFANKRWVFSDKTAGRGVIRQLLVFAGARVATLVLNIYIVIWTVRLLEGAGFTPIWIITPDFIAKMAAAVVVIITNFIISKLFVFRRGRTGGKLPE